MISNLSNMRSLVFPDCLQVTWLGTQFIPSLWPLSGNMTLLSMYRQGGLTFCHYYSWAWSIPLLFRSAQDYFKYFLNGGRDMIVLSSPQQYKLDYKSGQIWEEFSQPHQFKFERISFAMFSVQKQSTATEICVPGCRCCPTYWLRCLTVSAIATGIAS